MTLDLVISELIQLTISYERFSIKDSYQDKLKDHITGSIKTIDKNNHQIIVYWTFYKPGKYGNLGMYINGRTSNVVCYNLPHVYFGKQLVNSLEDSNSDFDKFLLIFNKLKT